MATADTNTLDPVIDDIVLRRLIEQAFERDLIPRDTVEKMIQPALERLGFSCERPPSLALDAMVEDFKEHFGLELGVSDIRRIAGDWRTSPISFGRLPPGADRTLVGWDNAEPTELSIIAGPKQYDEAGGHIDTPQTRLRDGHTVYTGRSNFYCRYRGKHMLVSLTDEEVQINGESTWQWSVAVRWAERPRDASSFIEALSGRIEGQLISERRGKILSSTYLPTSLRT
ncbi:MAG TPA: hypothetical protein VN495_04035, partial [Candidatus Paceibacterota bacterium]|nr:hypothetical protein [Candidatus Paceibacterota bacterium]